MMRLAAILSFLSLLAMILIDRRMGSRAEFLNAWSVVERLLGRPPTVGPSSVAQQWGPLGELFVVLVANAAIGAILALLYRLAAKFAG